MKNKFLVLWLAGILSTVAVLPYAFTLQQDIIAKASTPLPVIVLLAVVQTAILLAAAVFFGLKLSQSIGLQALAFSELNISFKENCKRIIKLAAPLGIATGVIILLGDKLFGKYIPQLAETNAQLPIWKTLLASLYGGVVEELLMRLFVVSLIAWLLGKIFRSQEVAKNSVIMWTAIIAAAILFGLGHLPITSSLTAITPLVIFRAIVLNGIGGLVFGWLYWKKGLEYSIAAHFTADIVLLAIFPALLK